MIHVIANEKNETSGFKPVHCDNFSICCAEIFQSVVDRLS